MKTLLLLACPLVFPAILGAVRLTDRLPAGGGPVALLAALLTPPALMGFALASLHPCTWAWCVLLALTGAALGAATSMALLAWCKHVGLLTFVWGDEQGGGLFLALTTLVLACWGALAALGGSLLSNVVVAALCGVSPWLMAVYKSLRAKRLRWPKRLGNVLTATIVWTFGALPSLIAAWWIA